MDTTKENYLPAYSKPRGVFITWRLVGILSVGVIAIGLVGLLIYVGQGTSSERGTRLLVEAYSKQRMIESRLSGGFKGGAFSPTENGDADINTVKVANATELIENAFDDNDPYSHLAYGRLLLSKGGKDEDALRHLRTAVAELPDKGEPHNDLGVWWMEQGDLEGALDQFNLALKSQANMPEALFNRGLCYEKLFLRDAASDDYRQLLAVESDRSWMNEIKRRQEEMSAPFTPAEQQADITKAFSAAVGSGKNDEAKKLTNRNLEILLKYAYRDSVIAYLNAVEAGDQSQADKLFSELKIIGEEFIARYDDTSIADVADYLSNLSDAERQTEIKLITEFLTADKFANTTESQASFEKLKNIFKSRHNYLYEFLSLQNFAVCDYFLGRYASSAITLKQCLALIKDREWSYRQAQVESQLGNALIRDLKWPYRLAQVESQLGNTYSRAGQDALAIKYCKQAIEHGKGAPLLESKSLQYLANAYWHLGDLKTGIECLLKSTSLVLTHAPQFGELAFNSLQIAESFRILGNNSLALLYAKQALSLAEPKTINNYLAQSASFIAVERARQNQFEGVDEGIERAFECVRKMPEKERAYNEMLVLTRAGEIAARRDNFESAVQYYSKAEAIIGKTQEKTIHMLLVLRGRASVYTQAKDYSKARLDLEHASTLIEDYRKNITDQKNKTDFLAATQSVFDDMIVLNVKVFANQQKAFDLSEKSRARTLLDELAHQQSASEQNNVELPHKSAGDSPANHSVNPLTLTEVQKALPDDLRLVTYSVTKQGTFIFLVTRSGFEWAESPATTEMLDQVVQDYVSSLKRIAPPDELSEKAHALYRYLIGPIEGRLGDGKQLCIVPDKALHFLPFAALVDESGKYLVDSYRLTYAPSASVLARCLAEARAKGKNSSEKILAVGNPQFSKAKFPNLDDLFDAEREANLSAAFYNKDSVVLNKEKATKQSVRAALMDCDVAHLSLHCLVEEKTPWLAALVLAESQNEEADDSSGNAGLLHLNEIYRMSLPRTRLVILSACESGLGQYYRGEGIVSLVRPFLALKVPTVIATLWSVDSQATAGLMIDFHRERKKNNCGAGDALRNAQLNMAHGSSYQHPYYWAPFIMVGSNN